ncbi:MAG TPA: M4 family metallopeptidase [Bacteroidales bacterium]|nr:M4 family metallopeptidase [Bacteroidales bacterium]
MKKLILLLIPVLFSQVLFSQIFRGSDADKLASGADIVRLEDFSSAPTFIHFRSDINMNVDKSLSYTKRFLKNENIEFVLRDVQKNRDLQQTYRYIQTYNGIPIEFSSWLVQVDNERVYALNGEILDDIQVNTVFILSEEQALQNALEFVGGELYMWQDLGEEQLLKQFKGDPSATYYPVAEKVIVSDKIGLSKSNLRTAYKFNIYSKKPITRQNIYVDAVSGEVLFDLSLIHVSDAIGTAVTQYSGNQQIHTNYTGTEYVLNDNTRGGGIRTLNCNMGTDYEAATEFVDNDNYWNNVNAQLDEYATDGHFATAATYDYYLNVHGRHSIDNDDYPLWSFVHFNLVEYGYSSNLNAFWNGQWMTYGDGTETITPLTTVDICAHEITHGLTSYTCNLNYQDESGALNEAFSDIFATAVEFYSVPSYADWTVGEDIGMIFRSLADPNSSGKPDTYQGEYWVFGTEDNGGVHTNMSPLCYWFYLVSLGGSGTNDLGNSYSVTGVGMDKAEQIAFRLQTVYLTPTSNYHDAWFYAMQAAADLYGACSDEVKAVGDGFYAIGVADPYVAEVHAGFDAVYTQACAPPFEVQFINQSYNGDDFLWTFGDGSTSTDIHPVHTYTDFGYFDVQLEVDGGACGSDIEIIEDFVIIDESIPCLTLMPTSGNTVVAGCNGLIYDAGGPSSNYFDNTDASITIYAAGSDQIVLNILEFDIEPGSGSTCDYDYIAFYNGSSTASPIINSTYYCNTTGNPETISSTGEYITIRFKSDPGLNMAGFKIQYDCIGAENPPTPYFSSDKQYTCDGLIAFSDNSLNSPTSWEWDFGDGTYSEEQNPVHTYTENGIYSVKLTAINEFGDAELLKTNYIHVDMPAPPVIDNVLACNDMSFIIDIDAEGILYWYDNPESESPVHVGNNWEHPALEETFTYYVQEVFESQSYNVGETNNYSGGGPFGNIDYIHYLIFDAYTPFLLESVEVNADGAGNRTIALRTQTQEIIAQKTVYCPNGISRIELNINVPVGTNLQIVGMGAPNLFRSNTDATLSYPYTIDEVVSIKSSSAGTYPLQYYYYFYDWEISTPECLSPLTSVELIPDICNSIANNNSSIIEIWPNPGNGLFYIKNLTQKLNCIEVTDVSGKIIVKKCDFNNSTLDLTNFADGVYFVKISNEKNSETIKVVKN